MNPRTWWTSLTHGAGLETLVAGLLASEFLTGTSLLLLDGIAPRGTEGGDEGAAALVAPPTAPGI
ncbi:hypothetical protein [Zavarzinia sp. CC-PAN008]|uniref:hypothetical protein n=1 Tax=Zavarzinia sp. CC-PAN008 TaxID=3243332 RepID=UPI003F74714A